MIRKNKLSVEEIKYMSKCFQEEIAPYLIYKYPKSENVEINFRFCNLIRKVDNYEDNENDLVYKTGMKFKYSENEEYYQ